MVKDRSLIDYKETCDKGTIMECSSFPYEITKEKVKELNRFFKCYFEENSDERDLSLQLLNDVFGDLKYWK